MSTLNVGPLTKDYMDKLGALCLFCMHPITKDELSKTAGNFQLLPQTVKVTFNEVVIKKYNKIFAVCGKCFAHSDMRMQMMKELFDITLDYQAITDEVMKQIKLNELKKVHAQELKDLVEEKKDVAKD